MQRSRARRRAPPASAAGMNLAETATPAFSTRTQGPRCPPRGSLFPLMDQNQENGAPHAPAASPTVSVVIPCFNQARYLPLAIASVRRQTRPPEELIVVDDGSTDGTSEVAAALGARVLTQGNQGLPEARNRGLAAAAGDCIVLLDADDELLPEAIERGLEALARHPHASAAVGRCRLMDAEGNELPARHHAIDPHDLYRAWLSHNFVWTPGAAIFRSAALRRIGGFPSGLGGAADYAVYLRLARTATVIYHGQDVVRYRQHAGSMSRDPVLMLRHTLAVLRRERAEAPAHRRADIARGVRTWRRWYGEHLIERLRADWRGRRFGRAQVRDLALLVWHCPAMALQQPLRKLRRLAVRASERVRQPSARRQGRTAR
jgi:glycosyltransferase involved in cell wall biosynthesis